MLRRIALTAVASLAALSAAVPATAASPLVPLPPLPLLQGDWPTAQDTETRLTVTVSESGNPSADGVFELECDPAGGSHPAAQRACDLLDEAAEAGDNPFVATDRNAMCTQQAGGPARRPGAGHMAGGERRRALQPGQRLRDRALEQPRAGAPLRPVTGSAGRAPELRPGRTAHAGARAAPP
ncbi:hypothetical protein RKD45_003641 [Streptomyces griseus]